MILEAKMKKLFLAPMIAFAVALPHGTTAQTKPFAEFIGKPVPNFTMTTVEGAKLTPTSLKGKAYIIDFWATWCGPCKAASPTLNKLHKEFAGKGLVVIGANVQDGDRATSKKVSMQYKKEHGYGYTFTYDNDALLRTMKGRGIPMFVFVDRKGVVKDVVVGFSEQASPKIFRTAITKIL